MTQEVDSKQSQSIKDEIIELEKRLEDAKARLNATTGKSLVTTRSNGNFPHNKNELTLNSTQCQCYKSLSSFFS
jgi:hypothetical protein